MEQSIRTFIAFKLPDRVISHLKTIQDGMRSAGLQAKWVRPANIHLTLKFLGNIAVTDVGQIRDAMAQSASGIGPISLKAKGVGIFPGIRKPRVLWAGLSGDTGQLFELVNRIENHLEAVGFAPETRKFKAHLTMARFKGRIETDTLLKVVEMYATSESQTFTADNIILFRSDLRPSGAVYTQLTGIPLEAPGNGQATNFHSSN